MSDKKRLIWIDSLKGWLMILVILGHAIQSSLGDACFHNHVWNIIYSFHMPAFMAISGWFAFSVTSKSINVGALCKRRFNQLMVPYLFMVTIALCSFYRLFYWKPKQNHHCARFLFLVFMGSLLDKNHLYPESEDSREISHGWNHSYRYHLYGATGHHGWTQPPVFRLSIPGLLLSVLLPRICHA